MIQLTNKSKREYTTSQGIFRPGMSREFPDNEAIQLLGYTGEIVRTVDAMGTDSKKMIEARDKEIKALKSRVAELETKVKAQKTKVVKDKDKK